MTSTLRFDRWENPDASESVTFDQLAGGTGLVPIVPTSVEVSGSGSSASANDLGKVTFATATSVSLNDVFSEDYQKYLVVWRVNSSANTTLQARVRVSGSDVSTSTYNTAGIFFRSTAATGTFTGALSQAFAISWVNGPGQGRASGTIDFDSPFIISQTTAVVSSFGADATSIVGISSGLQHITSASYTGLTFLVPSGTMLGEIQIFGYKE